MASITPITAFQDTEQSTSSTTPVDANCETSALSNGVDYLIIYTGNVGGGATSEQPRMQLLFGSTVLGWVSGEGRGLDNHWDGAQCSGFRKVTGNGTDTLKFQIWCGLSGDLTYAGAMAIIAIPLTELTENTDYWFSGTNSGTDEVTDASTSWETWRSQAFTLPASGDYLVLMSGECQAENSGGGQADSWGARYYVDSTEIVPMDTGTGHNQEWEDDTDYDSVTVASLVLSLSSGSRTFKMECGSRGSATANFRRSNIFVIRKAAFDQIIQTRDTTGTSTTSTSFVDFSGLNTTYTPNQQEYVVVMAHTVPGNSTTYTATTELLNDSDSTEHRVNSGEYNNDNGFDTERCGVPNLLAHCGQYSTAKNWKVRFRADAGGTAVIGRNRPNTGGVESNFIFWGLTTAEAPTDMHEAGQLGCNF